MNIFKLILLAIGTFILTSCNDSQQSSKQNEIKKLKIESYIDTIQKKYIGYEANGAIKEELNSYLKKDLKKAINTGVLTDLPFKLDRVEKCGNNYVLALEHSLTSKLYDRGVLGDIEIDLYALTDEKTAKSLVEGQFYLAEVEYKEYITFENSEKYCALVLMSPFMGYFDNEIQFGAIGVKLKSIVPIKQ